MPEKPILHSECCGSVGSRSFSEIAGKTQRPCVAGKRSSFLPLLLRESKMLSLLFISASIFPPHFFRPTLLPNARKIFLGRAVPRTPSSQCFLKAKLSEITIPTGVSCQQRQRPEIMIVKKGKPSASFVQSSITNGSSIELPTPLEGVGVADCCFSSLIGFSCLFLNTVCIAAKSAAEIVSCSFLLDRCRNSRACWSWQFMSVLNSIPYQTGGLANLRSCETKKRVSYVRILRRMYVECKKHLVFLCCD